MSAAPAVHPHSPPSLRVADLISALSYALDLTEGQPVGWAVRTCHVGLRLASLVGLPEIDQADLYYALLLKDTGGGNDSTAYSHRERGGEIVRKMGFSNATAEAIHYQDERWDGCGTPDGLQGLAIPTAARIIAVAQAATLFAQAQGLDSAYRVLQQRGGRWYDPELVRAAKELRKESHLWIRESEDEARTRVLDLDPGIRIDVNSDRMDNICSGFAEMIDAKSRYTFDHSNGVACAAEAIAREMGMAPDTTATVRRAALLHDIGKLGVSSAILDKPGRLTPSEWEAVKRHPGYTLEILRRVQGFDELASIASLHHERLDGSGYHLGLTYDDIPATARMVAVADVYDALVSHRPYREGLPTEQVFRVLEAETPNGLDPDCVAALKEAVH